MSIPRGFIHVVFLSLTLLLIEESIAARPVMADPQAAINASEKPAIVDDALPLDETFDELIPPALPSGWANTHSSNTVGWATVQGNAFSQPNAAFAEDNDFTTDKSLQTPPFVVELNGRVTFHQRVSLESEAGAVARDGAVLEISIAGGAFNDILAAGGSFSSGGYDHTISQCCLSPLPGRAAWSGSSGFQTVVADLPAAANGQTVILRWRVVTDFLRGVVGGGYWLDDVHIDVNVPFPVDETFEEVTPPALPSYWINNHQDTGPGWITEVFGGSHSNAAFTDDTNTVTDKSLETQSFHVIENGVVTFSQTVSLEASDTEGFDGVVLELAIGSGPFEDILDAGGSFVTGGYNFTISEFGANPLAGRTAWSGSSQVYQKVIAKLPDAANGQNVRLRWRMGTDSSNGAAGYWLDEIHIDVDVPPTDRIFFDDFSCLNGSCPG